MNRRSFLIGTAGTTVVLAGCVGRSTDDGAGRAQTVTERSSDRTTAGPTTGDPDADTETTEGPKAESSPNGSETPESDEPTNETIQRRVSLAGADDIEREHDLRIEVEALETTITASHTAKLRVTTTNEGEKRRISIGTGACTLFNRSRGASEQPGLFLHSPGSEEWIERAGDRWTRDANPSQERAWAAVGCVPPVYAAGESVTNEYAVWDDYRVEGYLVPGTYRFEEPVRILPPSDSTTRTPTQEPIAEFDWGFDLTLSDPEDR
jgi:hypothetical protein